MSQPQHFIYLLQPARPGLIEEATPEEETVLERHFACLQAALAEGRLILAGPCLDGRFGIVIFAAQSAGAALGFMQGDPAVHGGLMTAELHPFRISLQVGMGQGR